VSLPNISKSLHMSFSALAHLTEGLCLSAVLTLKVEKSLICLVCTRIPTVSMIEWQFIFLLKILIRNNNNNNNQWRYSPDRALASLTGFMIVIVRCGLSAPRSTWFYTPWFSHQRHPVVTTRDSSGEAGKHGWEMAAEFCLRGIFFMLVGFFYMP
jgi:hypothetical protein